MPNRVIKDSICESKGLSECSFFAADLYKRLITYADDYGRFNSDTAIIRARLYPREYEYVLESDIIDGLIELCGVGKIAFYTTKYFGQFKKRVGVYGVFPNWKEHQRIRESKAKCPEPDDTSVNDWYLRRFISMDMKVAIVDRDNFKCQECGKFLTSCRDARRFVKLGQGLFHIDHIVPVQQGGRATLENLRVTCPDCNLKRKKSYSFQEILDFTLSPQFAATCGDSPQTAAINQTKPEEESKSNTCASADKPQSAFEQFWLAYPKKKNKIDAQKAFKTVKAPLKTLLDAIERQKQSEQWKRDSGQFIPYPATWLRRGAWEDETEGGGTSGSGGRDEKSATDRWNLEATVL